MFSLRTFFGRSTVSRPVAAEDTAAGVRVTTDELIALRLKARELKLGSRLPAASAIAGIHSSRFRGRGMDYLESRCYQAGDDIRNMDWRVTARAGEPHVKLYHEERERPVVVLLDLNPGMFFGTRGAFKSVVAARAAALIGWAAVRNGDRIGALLSNGNHHELRPLGGQRGVLRLIQELILAVNSEGGAGAVWSEETGQMSAALQRLRRVARPGSLVYILSDFYGVDDTARLHLQRLRQHNDVVACQVVDALEVQPPPPGRYGISDGSRSGILDTRSAAQQAAYNRYFSNHHQAVADLMWACTIPLLQITTTDDVTERLRSTHTRSDNREGTGVGVAA